MTDSKHNKIFNYSFQVQEAHLDTFGHMNHATYLTIFEQARWDMITDRGYGLVKIHQIQIGPTILEANVKYKRELRLREKVRIETICSQWKGKIGVVDQKMFNEKEELCAEARLTVGIFDMKKRKLVEAPADWLNALGVQNTKMGKSKRA